MNNKMKLIFNLPHLLSGKGGAERIAVELANRLVGLGHEVAILCIKKDKNPSYALSEKIVLLQTPSMQNKKGQKHAVEVCKEFGPTAYFFFYSNGLIWDQYLIGKALGVPMGGQECTNPKRCVRNIANDLEIGVEEAATLRTAILSEMSGIRFTIAEYQQSVPPSIRQRISAFTNSFPNITKQDIQKQNVILNVSGLGKQNKNGLALIRAMAIVNKQYPDWKAVFVGSTSNKNKALKLAKELGIDSSIQIVDSVDDMNNYYSSAKLHVICSFEEGCPNVVCEAMLHGVPSIGYRDCEGTNHLIEHDENGLLVGRSDDEYELAEAIIAMIKDTDKREQFALKAYEKGIGLFDPITIYAQWHELLDRLHHTESSHENQSLNEYRYWLSRFSKERDRDLAFEHAAPLVSFIIPLYNKIDAIEATINSVLNCGYPSIEVLIIDDQSTDGSYEFVKEKFDHHEAIKIIRREKNGGLSAARNSGLEYAAGEYIQFWDADDIYYTGALEKLIESAIVGSADIVTGLAHRADMILPAYKFSQIDVASIKQPYCHIAFQTMSTCFKLYRRHFLVKHGLRFIDGLYMQDTEFNLRAFPLAHSVSMANIVIGEYVDHADQNRGSQVVSQARMNSALEIYERALGAHEGAKPEMPEAFWQYIVLKFVFRFFVSKLISENPGKYFSEEIDREYYLDAFKKHIANATPGIRKLIDSMEKNDWRWGLAFGLLQAGQDRLAYEVVKINGENQTIFEEVANILTKSLGLSRNVIIDRLQKLIA